MATNSSYNASDKNRENIWGSTIGKVWLESNMKRLLLRCIHQFNSDLNNNMDFMRISGTEPSSVILSQTKYVVSKVEKWCTKSAETSLSQKGWWNKPTKLQFQSILTQKILLLSKRYELTLVNRRTWLYLPSGTLWSTSSDTRKVLKRLLLRCIHHFESDLINNMDCMRILGIEPSSVILSQLK